MCGRTMSSGMTIKALQSGQPRLDPYALCRQFEQKKWPTRSASDSAYQTAVAEINQSIWAVNAEISVTEWAEQKDVATTKRNRRFIHREGRQTIRSCRRRTHRGAATGCRQGSRS